MPGQEPEPSPSDLTERWRARVASAPEAVAVTSVGSRELTAAELDREADRLALGFAARGLEAGAVVGIRLQNTVEFIAAMLAVWKAGGVALLLNPMYTSGELHHVLDDSGAAAVVCETGDLDLVTQASAGTAVGLLILPESPAVHEGRSLPVTTFQSLRVESSSGLKSGSAPTDTALLAYTSGTTGPAKGAVISHANVVASVDAFAATAGITTRDVIYAMAPFFHITGCVLNAALALLTGGRLVLTGRFDPQQATEAMAAERVTFTIGSITAYQALAATADRADLSSVRLLYSGGAPMAPSTLAEFEGRFGHYIHNAYGLTETTAAVVAVPAGQRAPVHGPTGVLSVGKALQGVQVRTAGHDDGAHEGELLIRGPSVVSGYWLDEPATAAALEPDGWLHTGDAAIVDDEGWVYLVDRIKDQINTSGYKVWPREVEDVLLAHDDVDLAAVVGVPDAYRGEAVTAFVTARPGVEVDTAALTAHCRNHLAAYKVPRRIVVVGAMPVTQSGKIQRRLLRGP